MAEFVFNGNANIFAAAVNNVVALKQDDEMPDSSQLTTNRQIELLLWLANLERRLPPYGDNN